MLAANAPRPDLLVTQRNNSNAASVDGSFERAGCLVLADRRLGTLIARRPVGTTAHQWNSATRTQMAFVVCDADSGQPVFAVETPPLAPDADAQRGRRMTDAVCEAVGLGLLRVASTVGQINGYGRRLVEYVIDARAYAAALAESSSSGSSPGSESSAPAESGYRDIVGRLPDGRTGPVNDLGAVARAAALDAYVARKLADPIIRGLHVRWRDGTAAGWAWLTMPNGQYLVERTQIWQYGFSCGVERSQLAEDLAVAALGERLKVLDTVTPGYRSRADLARDLDALRKRRHDMVNEFAIDHISFD